MMNIAEEISREIAADLMVSDPLSSRDLIHIKYTGIHFNSFFLPSASYILLHSCFVEEIQGEHEEWNGCCGAQSMDTFLLCPSK